MTFETSVLHKQNDTSRENSETKYFWVIIEPVLPNCRRVSWFICLFVWLYQESLISHKSVALLHIICCKIFLFAYCSAFRVVFVFFCFSNTENILVCLWIELTFLCIKTDNIHLSQRMEYLTLLIWIASEGCKSQTLLVPNLCWYGARACASLSVSRMHSR